MSSACDSDSDEQCVRIETKKRKRTRRVTEVAKKLRLSTHEIGSPCNCTRYKCFEVTTHNERTEILRKFNNYSSHDEQNSYLAGLISVLPVARKRPRKPDETANFRPARYTYRVRVTCSENVSTRDVIVCAKAFCAIHGITNNKLVYIKHSLKFTGAAPCDKRGKHSHFHRKLDDSTKHMICAHIKSFKGQ
ncbi:hypothetical protein ABEB36_012909 [Hypothenemus hampei]|uniref:Uncharacterized protein n=1 Tax=Hypothenemus hampei TaxID=57062 RepID=A0ABD1E893_HYPHA